MQDVITKDKIDALPDHAELRVAVGSIITRAAREKIKEKGITLQYIKENSKEGVADADQEKRDDKERGFVTVIGRDQVGIIAKVAGILAASHVNILDISQTVLQGYFTMIMIVDLSGSQDNITELRQKLEDVGDEIGLKITLQHEDIFRFMHRI
ncbi:MAG: ACT domain-containing protein [Syntrophaceticus sp.]|jgi:ACT domain-containing protein